MFGFGPATRIYVATGATDMRKGFNGLYGLVRDHLGCDPESGHVFLFTNARRNRLKQLVSTIADYGYARQSAILLRQAGVDISRAMCGWVVRVGEMLEPVVGAMRKELPAVITSRSMRRRWMCRRMISAARIIRSTYGGTGHRAGRRSSIFA